MKKSISLLIAIALILSGGIVCAIWFISPSITGNAVYRINSDEPNFTITKNLLGLNISTSEQIIYFSEEMMIDSNIDREAILSLMVNKTDVSDDCTDYENDCNISFIQTNQGHGFTEDLLDGQIINISKGMNIIQVLGECKKNSCPQNISVEISLFLIQEDE